MSDGHRVRVASENPRETGNGLHRIGDSVTLPPLTAHRSPLTAHRSPLTAPMPILRFDNVSKRYPGGHEALTDVSFAVEPGEMLFVTGHSGAGKSTLLRLIHLSERPSRGAVLVEERNLAKVRGRRVPLHRRKVGVVFQDHRLLMDRSVFENVALPLVIAGTPRAEIGKRVRVVLEKVGLADRERARPIELSSGEQQRVGIARAVVSQPLLLVADEPTGNLDPQLAAEIMQLFASLPAQGTSVLVASHDLHLVKRMRRRVLVLDHGRLVDDIAPEDLAA
jgi:cell division transport system ATP-binding protein